MNTTNENYNPADDGNQGVVQLMAQSEEANASVALDQQMNPVHASGPEPEKAEVNDSDVDANGVNNDLLEEEEVENGVIDETEDDQ
ncbi:hypothetical protein EXU85_24845 [Spirosoma sp. KCTC 42546]|uniref:hypothetical protein n=1 Tax=Spirosoma sp. KCTC 42546 TaxID=2520506 RepID=UPI00115AF99E|nr:hypothetical protein [Spirosoma sp. KCTC 42546]QDK81663.1 hypothetical protein EXU85_24845 [Spirosoma sp. KCTC 42546]